MLHSWENTVFEVNLRSVASYGIDYSNFIVCTVVNVVYELTLSLRYGLGSH